MQAAATLRASPVYTFFHVVLPLSLHSLVAGAAMSWARALGEFGATITFAGNMPGRTQTMPLAVYIALQTDVKSAVALSVILLAVSFGLLFVLRSVVVNPGK
ncbi:MAG: molybdate ABC transporter permease subunit [Terriglobia bacterium]